MSVYESQLQKAYDETPRHQLLWNKGSGVEPGKNEWKGEVGYKFVTKRALTVVALGRNFETDRPLKGASAFGFIDAENRT